MVLEKRGCTVELETVVEDRTRPMVETSQVMRSHYLQTNSGKLYLPAGTGVAYLYREFRRLFDPDTRNPMPYHTIASRRRRKGESIILMYTSCIPQQIYFNECHRQESYPVQLVRFD